MARRHFVETMELYVNAVVSEATLRARDEVIPVEAYMNIRRHTCAVLPSFAMIELGLDFDEALYRRPELECMREAGGRRAAKCGGGRWW